MGEGFVKLYASILDSSVWSYDLETRIVWITLLAMADPKGVVHAAVPGIARRANVSIEATQKALNVFQEPDPYSRSTSYDGCRVAQDGRDWLILNWDEHRQRQIAEDEKERKRKWWNENRGKNSKENSELAEPSGGLAETSSSEAELEVELEAEKEKTSKKEKPPKPSPDYSGPFSLFWDQWRRITNKATGKAESFQRWEKIRKAGKLPPSDELSAHLVRQDLERKARSDSGGWNADWKTLPVWLSKGAWDDVHDVETNPSNQRGPTKGVYRKMKYDHPAK